MNEVPKLAQNLALTPLDSIDISAVKFWNVLYRYSVRILVPLLL